MGDRYIGNPTTWATRYIDHAHFASEDDRKHVQLFANKYLESISQDPRHEAAALSVLCDYADLIALRGRLRSATPGTDEYARLRALATTTNSALIKSMNMARLKSKAQRSPEQRKKDVFGPAPMVGPRNEAPDSDPPRTDEEVA